MNDMNYLIHRDPDTREPLGIWEVPSADEDPIPHYDERDGAAAEDGAAFWEQYTNPDKLAVAEQLARRTPYGVWWDLIESEQDLEDLRAELWWDWLGLEPTVSDSKAEARARRLRFDLGTAPRLARSVLGSTTTVGLAEERRISEWISVRLDPDRDCIVVAVPHGESASTIDKALAWGLILQQDRDLHLVLPDVLRGDTPVVHATLVRCAFIRTPVRVWTYAVDSDPVEHVVPPQHVALASTRKDEAIPADVHDLLDRASWVVDLEERADRELTPSHVNTYRAWHIDGRSVLELKRSTSGIHVRAGTNYSEHRTDKRQPLKLELDGPITEDQAAAVWAAVDQARADRASGEDSENLEHLLQERLAGDDGTVALRLDKSAERELAATRPGKRRAYVDLTGVDENGNIRIIEVKRNKDLMLGLQGLDYWMWATAHRDELAELLRDRGHAVADKPKILLDYVVGTDDHSYLGPVLEAINGGVRMDVGVVSGWLDPDDDLAIDWRRPSRIELPTGGLGHWRFARRLGDHLTERAVRGGYHARGPFLRSPEAGTITSATRAVHEVVAAGQAHKFLAHVRSSQLFAINLFGALDAEGVTAVARRIDDSIVWADSPIFEYEDVTDALGEATSASPHRTQIDVVIRGHRGDGSSVLLLIEVKLTEDDFGGCSAFQDERNDRLDLCSTPEAFGGDPTSCFKLRNHDRGARRTYDEHLPIWEAADAGCPFRASGYQPMRQVALGAALVAGGVADEAIVVLCAHDDHGVIRRRWQEIRSASNARTEWLPASSVLAELDPDDADELADRYRLTHDVDDDARLREAAFRSRLLVRRVYAYGDDDGGDVIEHLINSGGRPDSAQRDIRRAAQRLERLGQDVRSMRESTIGPIHD